MVLVCNGGIRPSANPLVTLKVVPGRLEQLGAGIRIDQVGELYAAGALEQAAAAFALQGSDLAADEGLGGIPRYGGLGEAAMAIDQNEGFELPHGADLLVLRDALSRMAGALEQLADAVGHLHTVADRLDDVPPPSIPPRAD